jgi:hypothetical protein
MLSGFCFGISSLRPCLWLQVVYSALEPSRRARSARMFSHLYRVGSVNLFSRTFFEKFAPSLICACMCMFSTLFTCTCRNMCTCMCIWIHMSMCKCNILYVSTWLTILPQLRDESI